MKVYSLIYYYYLFLACIIMLIQVFLFETSLISDFSVYSVISPHSITGVFVEKISGSLFFVSLYYIFICGLSGIVFLVKKHKIWLGIMCVTSAAFFCFYIRQAGDGL
jgi:hypothetical protein